MKNTIMFLIVLLFFSKIQVAQDFGIKIGTISSNLESSSFISKSKIGHSLGITYNYDLGEDFSILYELGYADVGVKILAVDDEQNLDQDYYKFNIIAMDVGLIGNYFIMNPELSVQAGLSYTFGNITRIKEEYRYYRFGTNEELNTTNIESEDNRLDNLERYFSGSRDLAAVFGISGGQENIRVNLRYYLGLTPINNKNRPIPFDIKSNYFELSGLFFF